ncbi:MAG: glycosyltransferase family 4 protein [Lachnospiraceae bacterium]|jgi:glycosyltransferase involved in cell wall biosynthesis|nr:glycosyltransferase family 4 protein [Lachnospiraceae bacterium]
MQVIFVSNYLNHHQIPFCEEMVHLLKGSFAFLQMMPMEQERLQSGWKEEFPSYLVLVYQEPERSQALIEESEVVLFGGCEDERVLQSRLRNGKSVVRISERIYKEGQWKCITPRGLLRKYKDHTRYRKKNVLLLCAGGYVPSDFHIIRAYPNKMYRWGYFPETCFDTDKEESNFTHFTKKKHQVPVILWVGRFLKLKHPELAIRCAQYLVMKGYSFQMKMIGGGAELLQIQEMVREQNLTSYVDFLGVLSPEEVRRQMEQADIFLATSDRLEGWGAVINEAMNSGCAVVASHLMGATPYLIRHEINGLVYHHGHPQDLFQKVKRLLDDQTLRETLGAAAYETITTEWNAQNAAGNLVDLLVEKGLLSGDCVTDTKTTKSKTTPCSIAPVIAERRMYRYLTKEKRK